MSREKQVEEAYIVNNEQIKEMADFLWKNTLIHTEDLCHDVSETCYNAGYRKQSEGEWIFGKLGGQGAWVCSLCGAGFTGENAEWIAKEHIYCPKCGSKMKGGAE